MTGTDVFDAAQRSAVMRAVKARNTRPELVVRALVRNIGYARRYRLSGSGLPGKPDLVFGGLRKVVFVHGCFWHGHGCARGARAPKANAAYWRAKIAGNRARDRACVRALRKQGWQALILWECALRDRAAVAARLERFLSR
jgi:DNA mismatch endonuclease (patch repair protein)